MVALSGLSLRVLWISCLLINSVTCFPATKGYVSNNPLPASRHLTSQLFPSGHQNTGKLDSSSPLPILSYPSSGNNVQLPGSQNPSEKLSSSQPSLRPAGTTNLGMPNAGSVSTSYPSSSASSYFSSVNYQDNRSPSLANPSSQPGSFESFHGEGASNSYQASSEASFAESSSGYGYLSYEGSDGSTAGSFPPQDEGYDSSEDSEYVSYAGAKGEGYDAPQAGEYDGETSLLAGSYYGSNVGGYVGTEEGGVVTSGYGYDATEYSSVGFDEVPEESSLESTGPYSSSYDSEEGGSGSFSEFTSEGDEEETPEAVFSDVSDLEPVFSFSSRSSYQRGRTVYSQTTYTPGEVQEPKRMPVDTSSVSLSKRPYKAPSKGGL